MWHLEYLNNYKEVEVVVNVDEDMRFVSDRYRLSVILHNLITNAFRYIDNTKSRKGVAIEASIKEDTLVLVVEDNGIGMKEDVQKRAYEMFFRGTNKSDGAGLGLYITKESVVKLGGTIDMASAASVAGMLKKARDGYWRAESRNLLNGLGKAIDEQFSRWKLTEAERAALLASIKEAEADIAEGRFIEFGPGEFGPWLRERVEAIRRKKHGP
ncbi:MAG: sensor histidine kinase [Bacteroidia bacterium]|nr:sensor histidine kinase [Bacteroidia bacterium]